MSVKVSDGDLDVSYYRVMWPVGNLNLCSFINTS
jgi:hypothetical protein